MDGGAENAFSSSWIVKVADFADAFVTTWHIHARLSVVYGATVLSSGALVHVHAETESRGPFVARFQALAADVYLVGYQAEEILIFLPVQRARSVL